MSNERRVVEIEAAIAMISDTMKGPLSNFERAWLHEDRKDLRKELAELKAQAAPGGETKL